MWITGKSLQDSLFTLHSVSSVEMPLLLLYYAALSCLFYVIHDGFILYSLPSNWLKNK